MLGEEVAQVLVVFLELLQQLCLLLVQVGSFCWGYDVYVHLGGGERTQLGVGLRAWGLGFSGGWRLVCGGFRV